MYRGRGRCTLQRRRKPPGLSLGEQHGHDKTHTQNGSGVRKYHNILATSVSSSPRRPSVPVFSLVCTYLAVTVILHEKQARFTSRLVIVGEQRRPRVFAR